MENEITKARKAILLYALHARRPGPRWSGHVHIRRVLRAVRECDANAALSAAIDVIASRCQDRSTLVATRGLHGAVERWVAVQRREEEVRNAIRGSLLARAAAAEESARELLRQVSPHVAGELAGGLVSSALASSEGDYHDLAAYTLAASVGSTGHSAGELAGASAKACEAYALAREASEI